MHSLYGFYVFNFKSDMQNRKKKKRSGIYLMYPINTFQFLSKIRELE